MSSAGLSAGADAAQRGDEIGKPFEREVFAVQRDQHGVGRDQRVEREQPERRRRVDDDESEARAQRFERVRGGGDRDRSSGISSISAPARSRVAGIT